MPRILVVDDEEGVRSFLAEALEDAGYSVVDAATATPRPSGCATSLSTS